MAHESIKISEEQDHFHRKPRTMSRCSEGGLIVLLLYKNCELLINIIILIIYLYKGSFTNLFGLIRLGKSFTELVNNLLK